MAMFGFLSKRTLAMSGSALVLTGSGALGMAVVSKSMAERVKKMRDSEVLEAENIVWGHEVIRENNVAIGAKMEAYRDGKSVWECEIRGMAEDGMEYSNVEKQMEKFVGTLENDIERRKFFVYNCVDNRIEGEDEYWRSEIELEMVRGDEGWEIADPERLYGDDVADLIRLNSRDKRALESQNWTVVGENRGRKITIGEKSTGWSCTIGVRLLGDGEGNFSDLVREIEGVLRSGSSRLKRKFLVRNCAKAKGELTVSLRRENGKWKYAEGHGTLFTMIYPK